MAATMGIVSGRVARVALDGSAARRACCGARTSATRAATNVPMLTAPMNTGRCMALRARQASQVGRDIGRGYSLVGSDIVSRTGTPQANPTLPPMREERNPSAPLFEIWPARSLLHRNRALHVHGQVRRAVVRNLARL